MLCVCCFNDDGDNFDGPISQVMFTNTVKPTEYHITYYHNPLIVTNFYPRPVLITAINKCWPQLLSLRLLSNIAYYQRVDGPISQVLFTNTCTWSGKWLLLFVFCLTGLHFYSLSRIVLSGRTAGFAAAGFYKLAAILVHEPTASIHWMFHMRNYWYSHFADLVHQMTDMLLSR